MLILSRRQGETICIGENIEIKIMACSGRHVRVGITAPSDISVHRKEIYDRIKDEAKLAAPPEAKSETSSES